MYLHRANVAGTPTGRRDALRMETVVHTNGTAIFTNAALVEVVGPVRQRASNIEAVNQPEPEPEPEPELTPEPEPDAKSLLEEAQRVVGQQRNVDLDQRLGSKPETTGWAHLRSKVMEPGQVPPIENRAVSLEFLEKLCTSEFTPEIERSATADAIDYLERQLRGLAADGAESSPNLPECGADATDEELAAAIFTLADTNRDGRVGVEEIGVLRRLVGVPPPTERSWALECHAVGGDPAAGLTLTQFAALFARPLATSAAALYSQLGQARRARLGYGARDLERRRAHPYLSGRDVHRFVIKKKTHGMLCRYIELDEVANAVDSDGQPSVGPADVFVSWTWDTPWETVMGTLRAHAAAVSSAGRRPLRYWIDIFAINQHTALPPWLCDTSLGAACRGCKGVSQDMMSMDEMAEGRTDKGFERVINSVACRETLLVIESWSNPRPISRVWCLYEVLLTLLAAQRGEGCRVVVGLPVHEQQQLAAALETDLSWVQRVIGAVDGENAEATRPEDRDKIFWAVRRLLPRGFVDLNSAVKDALREWTYEAGEHRLAELPAEERFGSGLIVALGSYCEEHARYTQAEALLREAVDGRSAAFGREDARTLHAMSVLASVREGQDEYGEAEPLMEEVVRCRRQQLGDRDPSTLEALSNLGLLHRKMSAHEQAERELVEAADGRRSVLGSDDPQTLQSVSLLGALYESSEDYEKAEPLMREAVEGRKRVLGPEHPLTLESMTNLGALFESMGRFEDGELLLSAATEARRRVLGDEHPGTLDSIGCFGLLLSRMERHAEAEPLLREAAETSRRVLGASHPDTLIALFNLAELLEKIGAERLGEALALFEEELQGQLAREDLEEAADSARQLLRRLVAHDMSARAKGLEALCEGRGLSLESESSSSSSSSSEEEQQ